jgi:hypothetical protein
VWAFLIVFSTPSLQLFGCIFKAHEPVRVQALRPEPAIERLDEGVVGRFARTREVLYHVVGIGPKVHILGDELAALVNTDGGWVAGALAYLFKRRDLPPAKSLTMK